MTLSRGKVLLLGSALVLGSACAACGAESSGHPRLLVTPERRAVWSRMQADGKGRSPKTLGGTWFALIRDNAEAGDRYSDNGLWATLAYQMTGDAKYVPLAWRKINSLLLSKQPSELRGNFSREFFIQYVLMYDWLYPALSAEQRAQLLGQLNAMAESVLTNRWAADFPIRAADSDQMVGDYFGLASFYLITREYNPKIVELWERPYVGGLTPTGTGSTFRNVIHRYVTKLAAGGEWIESESYNLGTVKLLALGSEMVRTASGRDYFPEVTELLPKLALRMVHRMTPDLRQSYQWGDEEHPRDLRLFYRVETGMVLAGLTQSDRETGPYIQDLVLSLVEKYGTKGFGTAEPWPRGFLVYNPYAPRASRADLPRASYAEGMGMLQYRSGWDESASLFSAHFPPILGIDHTPSYFGEFQLYRDGEWAVTHALSYAGPGMDGRGTNSMLVGGLPTGLNTFLEFRRAVASDSTDDWAFIAGTAGGQVVEKTYWQPPPSFLHEWTRSLVYLPALDAVVVHDRVAADDPRKLPMNRHRPEVAQAMKSMPALKQWLLHATARPRMADDLAEWDLKGGDTVRVHMLLPEDRQATVLDEKQLWPGRNVVDSEKAFTLRVTPAADRTWDTFLNVVHAGGPGVTARLVRSDEGEAEGVAVTGPRGDNLVLLFNARPSEPPPGPPYSTANQEAFALARLARRPFSISLDPSWAAATVYAFHLDPELKWSVDDDGGGRPAWTRRESGVFAVTVRGAGAHRLTFRPSGQAASADGAATDPAPGSAR